MGMTDQKVEGGRASDEPLLLPMKKAAEKLGMDEVTLRDHVRAGDITYIKKGKGKKRHHRLFAMEDIEAFIAKRRKRDGEMSCPSTGPKVRRTTNTISGCEVIDFTDLRAKRQSAKPNK